MNSTCTAGFPIKQIICLLVWIEGGKMKDCVEHADLFKLNLNPLIFLSGPVVLVY